MQPFRAMVSPSFWGDALVHIPTYTFNSVGPQLVEACLIATVALLFGGVPYGFLHLLGAIGGHALGSLCAVTLFYVTQSKTLFLRDAFLPSMWNCTVVVDGFLVSTAQELEI